MQRLLLATVAVAALSLPAAAQQQQNSPMGQNTPQNQNMSQTQGMSQQSGMQSQQISASNLSQEQIRQIQQALNQKGFSSGSVDGVWGPETAAALENFQKTQNMQANGQLNAQTISALGLDSSQFGATTTGMGGSSQNESRSGGTTTGAGAPGTSGATGSSATGATSGAGAGTSGATTSPGSSGSGMTGSGGTGTSGGNGSGSK